MTVGTDQGVYALFERIVREAPDADVYNVQVPMTRGDGSIITWPDGSPHKIPVDYTSDQKELIPWGEFEGIKSVTWYPTKDHRAGDPYVNMRVGVHARGITIEAKDLLYSEIMTIGVEGVAKTALRGVVAFPDEDAVVAEVLRRIEFHRAELIGTQESLDDDLGNDELLPVGWRSIDDGEF